MFLYFIGATADMEDMVENPWMLRIKLVVKNESFWKWALDGAKGISVYTQCVPNAYQCGEPWRLRIKLEVQKQKLLKMGTRWRQKDFSVLAFLGGG